MLRWSTDQVDPKDRFDNWREVRAEGLSGVTAELAPEHRPAFTGEFLLRKIGTASLIELRASPDTVERSAGDIANASGDSLCIFQQLRAGSRFGGDPDLVARQGTFIDSSCHLVRVAGHAPDRTQIQRNEPFFSEKSGLVPARKQISEKFQNIKAARSGRPLTHHGMNSTCLCRSG